MADSSSNPTKFSFTLEAQKGEARAGTFVTPHGEVQTPIFMPVGTHASVKALDAHDIEATQAQIILANTYHLYLRPGMTDLEKLGGVHKFMGWSKPMLTDSGGFQVFSLGAQAAERGKTARVKITDEGVKFTSHLDGSQHFFSPAGVIQIQRQIGADIIMAFDECTPDQATERYSRQALDRTHRWARECFEFWQNQNRESVYGTYQALFGIVQGALHPDLRRESAQFMANLDFDGLAVGGETIGYNMPGTLEVMSWIRDELPTHKPRYAMGLGREPQNIIDAVMAGFDMFDCVAPTRLARNGALYHGELALDAEGQPFFDTEFAKGRLQIGRSEFATDASPIMEKCDCYTCTEGYSRAYLHHLYKTKELAYYRLASIHNVRVMVRLTENLRDWIMKSAS